MFAAFGIALPLPKNSAYYDSGYEQVISICNRLTWRSLKSSRSSMDSDLEAFSHNPTRGGVTALAFQLTVYTNYVNKGFLSY